MLSSRSKTPPRTLKIGAITFGGGVPFPVHAVLYAGGPADKALRSGYKDVVGFNFCSSGFASPLRAGCAVVAGFGSNAVSTACTFVCFPFLVFVSFCCFRALSNSNATRCLFLIFSLSFAEAFGNFLLCNFCFSSSCASFIFSSNDCNLLSVGYRAFGSGNQPCSFHPFTIFVHFFFR